MGKGGSHFNIPLAALVGPTMRYSARWRDATAASLSSFVYFMCCSGCTFCRGICRRLDGTQCTHWHGVVGGSGVGGGRKNFHVLPQCLPMSVDRLLVAALPRRRHRIPVAMNNSTTAGRAGRCAMVLVDDDGARFLFVWRPWCAACRCGSLFIPAAAAASRWKHACSHATIGLAISTTFTRIGYDFGLFYTDWLYLYCFADGWCLW